MKNISTDYQKLGEKPLSYGKFLDTFHDVNFLSLALKKDLYDTCYAYEVKLIDNAEWDKHMQKVDRALEEIKDDVKIAKTYLFRVFTRTLHIVKVCHFVQAGAIYYRNKTTAIIQLFMKRPLPRLLVISGIK